VSGRGSIRRQDWRLHGTCVRLPPLVLWVAFYDPPRRGGKQDWTEARAICRACPVLTECHAWTCRDPDRAEFTGGLAPREWTTT
jgi:hypothetical protein